MLETSDSLLPQAKRVLVAGDDPDSLAEIGRLLATLEIEIARTLQFDVRKISPATYIGSGKVQEIKQLLESEKAQAVIFDFELSPHQLRNLESELLKPILDRPGVIIEIFSRHARTRESKTQVALARLQYLLPRLAHFWDHFERQRGGGTAARGMGEKQIEVDRRLVKTRISVLKGRLKEIEQERKIQRQGRKDIYKVALVGYTNAGKSTLLNALTHSAVLAEDKLFATLDSSVRALDPHSHPPIVVIDTVGFIDRLPPTLVASFRSTLEELHQADLLLHVVDASHERAREQLEVTQRVLAEIGLSDKPTFIVLNKGDLLTGPGAQNRARVISPGSLLVSAFKEEEMARLRSKIQEHFRGEMASWELVVPYSEARLEAQLHEHGVVENKKHLEKGTFYRVRIHPGWATRLDLQRYKT